MKILIIIGLILLVGCNKEPPLTLDYKIESQPTIYVHSWVDPDINPSEMCYANCSPIEECNSIDDFDFTKFCNESEIEWIQGKILKELRIT